MLKSLLIATTLAAALGLTACSTTDPSTTSTAPAATAPAQTTQSAPSADPKTGYGTDEQMVQDDSYE